RICITAGGLALGDSGICGMRMKWLPEAQDVAEWIGDAEIAHAVGPVVDGDSDWDGSCDQLRQIAVDVADLHVQARGASWASVGTTGQGDLDLVAANRRHLEGRTPLPGQIEAQMVD